VSLQLNVRHTHTGTALVGAPAWMATSHTPFSGAPDAGFHFSADRQGYVQIDGEQGKGVMNLLPLARALLAIFGLLWLICGPELATALGLCLISTGVGLAVCFRRCKQTMLKL
jgi:hypothetical protein